MRRRARRTLVGRVETRLRAGLDGDRQRFAIGALAARYAATSASLRDSEFRVYSQWNEDGILNFMTRHLHIPNRTFVEIGVEDYRECNSRFLAEHGNWSGLAIDGGASHARFIKNSGLDWRFGVRPVCAFVTAENINDLIADHGLAGDIGLLSIDVDGVDYWLFDAVSIVQPRIVVVEYNALFGPVATVTVPYDPGFTWDRAHWSKMYHGASLAALVHLADAKGYDFVGCESHGVNAFFVRRDLVHDLERGDAVRDFVPSRFPVGRSQRGEIDIWKSPAEKLSTLQDLPLFDVFSRETVRVGDI